MWEIENRQGIRRVHNCHGYISVAQQSQENSCGKGGSCKLKLPES